LGLPPDSWSFHAFCGAFGPAQAPIKSAVLQSVLEPSAVSIQRVACVGRSDKWGHFGSRTFRETFASPALVLHSLERTLPGRSENLPWLRGKGTMEHVRVRAQRGCKNGLPLPSSEAAIDTRLDGRELTFAVCHTEATVSSLATGDAFNPRSRSR